MPTPVISVEKLSKAYRIGLKDEIPDTLVGALQGIVKAPLRNFRRLSRLNTFRHNGEAEDTIWALKDVSFDVQEGEVLGIIGRNGAGKSTLLKILSRITEPTSGRAVLHGRVSSLLEVGTGFHPELSGRENVYLNGTILGMTKREIDRKFDQIVDFSGVEKFLDTPVKRYSSGMKVRLAFAVAAHLEPEILIIDEVLAVGDAEFQQKCLGKMQDVARGGRTVLFVSHNMAAVESLCHRTILLRDGLIHSDGDTRAQIRAYHRALGRGDESNGALRGPRRMSDQQDCVFQSATLLDEEGHSTNWLSLGGVFHLRLRLYVPGMIEMPSIGVGIDDSLGQRAITLHTPLSRASIRRLDGKSEVDCIVKRFPLAPGEYSIKLAMSSRRDELDAIEKALSFTVVDGNAFGEGRGHHRGYCVVPSEWRLRPH